MLNGTSAKLKELSGNVDILNGNLDQFFLVIMGCLIFCEYDFLCYRRFGFSHFFLLMPNCFEMKTFTNIFRTGLYLNYLEFICRFTVYLLTCNIP